MEAEFTLDPNVQLGRYRNAEFQGLAPGCFSFRLAAVVFGLRLNVPGLFQATATASPELLLVMVTMGLGFRVCDFGCRV